MAEKEPIGVIGVGWVGLCTAACFAELGHEVVARDILPEKVESLSRGEVPIHEPGLPELVTKNADRLHFTTDMGEVLERTRLLFCCVDTPPTYSGDADLSRVEAVVDELGDSDEHAIVMKSTVPVGTGRSIQRRRERPRLRVEPRVPQGGLGGRGLHAPRPRGGRRRRALRRRSRDRVAALYEPLGGPIVRTDVASAEMIKLASNAFLATKISFINEIANVSEELGADVSEVARGMGLDDRIGHKFLQAGIGYRRLLLPQGRDRAQAARRQLRLPLPAAHRGDRGQRAPEAPHDRQAAEAPRLARRQGDRAARRGVQAQHRRHPRGHQPRAGRAAPGRGRATCACTTRWRPTTRREMLGGARVCDSALEALDGADAAVLVTEWPEFARARLGRRGQVAGWRSRSWSTAATSSTARRCARPASPTRASAR